MESALVCDRTAKNSVTGFLALYLETVKPIRPMIVQMSVDLYLVNLQFSSSLNNWQILSLELPDVEIEFTGGRTTRNHINYVI